MLRWGVERKEQPYEPVQGLRPRELASVLAAPFVS